MLYGNQSISHYSPSNIIIWMIMAFQAGLLNIGGFLAGHKIVSHVTGFATFFGYEISTGSGNASSMLIVPAFFLLGAMISGYFVDIRIKLLKKPRYYITFGFMFFLTCLIWFMGIVGKFGTFGEHSVDLPDYVLLMLLCLVCGIQNGTISTVSRSIVRTTHLTGITTDLGLGIVRILYRKKLKDKIIDEDKANLMRVGIITFFVLGSIAGGYLFAHFRFHGFLVPVLISGSLFSLMLYFQVLKPRMLN